MKNIKSIELALENCEGIKFERNEIESLRISDITRTINLTSNNEIDYIKAKEVVIHVLAKGNTFFAYSTDWSSDTVRPFERIVKGQDIIGINIVYEDDSEEYIFVNWCEESEYHNKYQSAKIDESTGDLYVVISEKNNIKNCFIKV